MIGKAMTEQGMQPLRNGHQDFLTYDQEYDDKWTLRIGDQISIYMDTDNGYAFMSAYGIENFNAR
jgi:hypothetical protein